MYAKSKGCGEHDFRPCIMSLIMLASSWMIYSQMIDNAQLRTGLIELLVALSPLLITISSTINVLIITAA